MQRRGESGQPVKGRRAPKARKASTAHVSAADLQEQVAALTRERDEALQQQTATSDVLKVISSSPGELEPVFHAILENATRICSAKFGVLWLCKDSGFEVAATHGIPAAYREQLQLGIVFHPGASLPVARAATTRQAVHIADLRRDPAYLDGEPVAVGGVELAQVRTLVAVPMLKDQEAVGAFAIFRQEVLPFTDKQVESVQNFAAQAVIAIENTRLLNELRESLQQQTATADVLKVISRSTFDLQTVLNTLVESAAKLCEAYDCIIFLRQGDKLHIKAMHGPIGVGATEYQIGRGWVNGRAFVDRTPIHVHDLSTSEEFPEGREMARRRGHRTILSVPLLRGEEAIGVISIRRFEVKPFTDKQIELLKTFADQAVIAIENVRLFDDVQKRTQELSESLEQQTATSEVLNVISNSLTDTQRVFDAIVQSGLKLFPHALISVALRDEGMIKVAAIAERDPERVEAWRRTFPYPVTREYMHSTAILDRKIVDIADVREAPLELATGAKNFLKSGYRAITIMPMMRGSEAIGALSVVRVAPGPLSDKQLAVLRTFAAQAVIAIENTRLLSELRESLQQQTATADVLKVISRSVFDLQPVLDTLVTTAARLCNAEMALIFRRHGDVYRLAANFGFPQAYEEFVKGVTITPGRGTVSGRALFDRQAVHILDVTADPEYAMPETHALGKARTALGVPLLRENEPIGVIALARQRVEPFSDKQIELVTTFADQAVIAIENVRLFDEVQARTRDLTESLQQQTATADVLQVISRSAFDLQPVFDTVAESSVRLCGADKAFIFRFDGEVLRMVAGYNASAELAEFVRQNPIRPGRHTGTARAALERRTVHIPDVLSDPEYTYGAKNVDPIRTVLGVPIIKDDELFGVIMIYRLEVKPFAEKQIALVETFADQAAIAIENVRLFEEVQSRTRELTQSVEELRALGEVSQAVNSTLDLENVLSTIVAKAVQLSGTEGGAIYVFDEMEREFHLRATYGMDQELINALASQHIGLDEPNVALAFAQSEPT